MRDNGMGGSIRLMGRVEPPIGLSTANIRSQYRWQRERSIADREHDRDL
ncbi:MAG: hypothetical protein AB7W37_16930 [Syntrophobacteraceae bacterium]